MEELEKFFKEIKMFFIATIENNQPRVRPFGNILFNENHLYINTGRKKRFYKQVMENPHVELCAFDKGVWFRVQAIVEECEDAKIRERTMESDPFVKKSYANRKDELVVFELKQVKAYRCKFNAWDLVYETK